MFDIGFWELSLIFVVALIVLGPDRLPRTARTVGLWVGKARQTLATVKADIDRELHAEELRAMMNKPAEMSELMDFEQEVNKTVAFDGDAVSGTSMSENGYDPADKPKLPSDSAK